MINPGQRIFVERLINQYGFSKVENAFIEASAEKSRMNLPYVRGILKGIVQKAAIDNEKKTAAVRAAEVKAAAGSGKVGGLDFSEILRPKGKKESGGEEVVSQPAAVNPKYDKNSDEYKKIKAKFDQELRESKL